MSFITWTENGTDEEWVASSCRDLGHNEEFLEARIAMTPTLLGLESRRTGLRGPYRQFRKLQLPTPTQRVIEPDLVFLTASGHMIVVEVKLADNPELSRRVIAQIVEYAGSLAALDDRSLLSMFPGGYAAKSWAGFVKTCFPNEYRVDELAQVLRDRISAGQINIVIACDGVSSGVRQLIAGIAAQSAIGFELDVVEITPYVCASSSKQVIAFIPTVRVSTEIVARTYPSQEPHPTSRFKNRRAC